jgi:hypothetical protein
LQEGAKKKMSLKDWKNNELRTVLSERWGFSFNLLNESQEEALEEEAPVDTRGQGQDKATMCKQIAKKHKEELDFARGGSHDDPTVHGAFQTANDLEEKFKGIGCDKLGMTLSEEELYEEEELDEEKKKMVKCGDKGMMPDYACDGEGQNDEREGGAEEKETSKKPKMNEAQIRSLVRRLVKEAMAKKAK